MGLISDLFNLILIDPLTNLFVVLGAFTGNAGIAVILLTIIIRLLTLPLTLKQMHSTRVMAMLSPRMQEIQRKYKDPRRRSEEQMRLYKELGINPLGCASSMILQFPILIALYRTFTVAVGDAPESLIQLSQRLYPIDFVRGSLPLNAEFLWLHLGRPDPIILPVLVAATTYILQKLTMMPATDERMRAQNSMMNMMMPLLFGWITISLPSGLGLYYVLSNVIGMVMQYLYVGGGAINWRALVGLSQDPVLPRALEVRQEQESRVSRAGAIISNEETGVEKARSNNGAAAARSRRRYSSGRRRGRR
jgi:YidC/Oxa1 family membrane protein insertase